MTRQFASNKHALGICDRCGRTYKLKELREERVNLNRTNILVCKTCWDPDHPQNWQGRIDYSDPQALRNPRIDTGEKASTDGDDVRYDFKTDTDSFSATNATLTFVTGGTVSLTATTADPQMERTSSVSILASEHVNVRSRVKRLVAGTWSGQFYWKRTTDGAFAAGRSLTIGEPDWIGMGDPYRDILWEMDGVTDWDGTIDGIRFDFFNANLASLEIEWIVIEKKVDQTASI